MFWVVQNNLYNEAGYVHFLEALERLKLEYLIVKPVPFTNKILPADFDSSKQEVDEVDEPVIDTSQKVIVFGAITLVKIAKNRGWIPGAYLNDNFNFNIWSRGFGLDFILNGDAVTGTVTNIQNTIDDNWLFVRPVHDTKSFSGTVMSKHDLDTWIKEISVISEEEFSPLHRNTEIIIAPCKEIYSEYRMFVVDGKVITGSLYKQGNRVVAKECIDDHIISFAQSMVDNYQPAKAFALDIAETDNGLKIVEINNINSAGFYEADVQKLIFALEQMEEQYGT